MRGFFYLFSKNSFAICKSVVSLYQQTAKTMANANNLIGYAKISGTNRTANVYNDGSIFIKNYIGEFVEVINVNILEFYYF